MHKISLSFFIAVMLLFINCNRQPEIQEHLIEDEFPPFLWENATIYFLLVDRFYNGTTANDQTKGSAPDAAPLRGFMGGDLKGIIQKLDQGYFKDLGVTALWINPVVEQIAGAVDEGTGKTYGYHGYWARDWTAIEPNFGTMADFKELVQKAHAQGIRILLDVVINHTGPVTAKDSQWPDDWVRTGPKCTYTDWENTVKCTLVENLPDIRTEKEEDVALPDFLIEKWKNEGRLDRETEELDAFFARTGYPRAPRFYIIKWLVDYVRELGIDGFRVDTAKHTEAGVWKELYLEAVRALNAWREENSEEKLDDADFYMVGEVYNYAIQHGESYTYDGDTAINFYDHGFKSLLNFSLKTDLVQKDIDSVFTNYATILNEGELKGKSVVNYLSSHDDGNPFDPQRIKVFETANYLMLAPGGAQIYYGDETGRLLQYEGAVGDANLRTFMNWEELDNNVQRNGYAIKVLQEHWQKLGNFRKHHPAIGAGKHEVISRDPYIFKRTLSNERVDDRIIVGMEDNITSVDVRGTFAEGETVVNFYTGESVRVEDGKVVFSKPSKLLLLEAKAGI